MAAETLCSSSSFPYCSSNAQRTYDVFLSFRGMDTRKSFTDHLYAALDRGGIFTFRDEEELARGQPISRNLLEAIQVSRIAVVVFSRNYASSTWCLDELAKIVECMDETGQKVIPIFYDVDPSEVRNQLGKYGEAFDAHEERFKAGSDKEKLQKWRAALTQVANLSGFHLQDRYESKFIQEIMEMIVSELKGTNQTLSNDLGLVGIDFRVEEIKNLCSVKDKENDVVFIGIWGMGGIGKTTLAQAFYDKVSYQFSDKSFLKNVRESSKRDGIVALTKDLLFSVLKRMDVHDSEIRHRLRFKKVLIILDDVDKLEQLQALAGSNSWFGRGSRIIITTRDEQLLIAHHVDRSYKVKELKNDDALELFSWKAFKSAHPPEDYLELSQNFVNYSKGLPLAIKVLGAFLCGQSPQEWKSAFSRIQENLDNDIMSALRISFDGLHEKEKEIFLDIACFFKGHDRDQVAVMLESFGFHPIIGIRALIRKSLITLVGNKLWMHDLLQEMGWELVRAECLNEPGNCSRIWQSADVLDVMKHKKGSDSVQGIVLVLPQEQNEQLKSDALSNLKKLRFLKISNVLLPRGLNYLSTELQVVEWNGYPSKLLPKNFPSKKLVQLSICCSRIEYLWKGYKSLEKLKSIDLKDSTCLMETPDFTGVPNLEKLILEDLADCKNLLRIPSVISSLTRLKTIILSGCSSLGEISENIGNVEGLEELDISGTAIRQMPSSIVYHKNLKVLSCSNCDRQLSTSLLFRSSPSLCPALGMLSPSSFSGFSSLTSLNLSYCNLFDGAIPNNLDHLSSLKDLFLGGNNFTSIPESICRLSNLARLVLDDCSQLQSFPKLPLSIKGVWVSDCMSLKSDSDQYEVCDSTTAGNVSVIKRISSTICIIDMSYSQFAAWLRDYHEANEVEISQRSRTAYGLSTRAFEIPNWFDSRSNSQSVTILLPTDNKGKPWMGYALYVVLEIHEDFDTNCDLKVKHKFDCYFDTMEGPGDKQTLYHEVNVESVPFTGSHGYWIIIPHVWFLKGLNSLNECNTIEAHTTIDSPAVEVKKSGARLLYDHDFIGFLYELKSYRHCLYIRRKKENSGQEIMYGMKEQAAEVTSQNSRSTVTLSPTLAEDQHLKFNSTIPVQEHLESLPSELNCSEGIDVSGSKYYNIHGRPSNLKTAFVLGKILEEYSGRHDLLYKETFSQSEIPEWFCSVNGSSTAFTIPRLNNMTGWKGVVVCSAFAILSHPSLIQFELYIPHIQCSFGSGSWKIPMNGYVIVNDLFPNMMGHGFIWILYVSHGSFQGYMLNKYTPVDMQVKFKSNSKDITVESCGYQLVFQENMEELMEIIMQCSTCMPHCQSLKNSKRKREQFEEEQVVEEDEQGRSYFWTRKS
ncbi:TMV resistance protein N isoform X2 [Rosa chinensis]|uniref:TMV resistance protein N isoform X2 n=1 Tax=Rosa chinensis TaxID=74649 RepID=UPI001AD8DA21|nr:TMV resistance protein N isoform X2 [Rosa chinensis]